MVSQNICTQLRAASAVRARKLSSVETLPGLIWHLDPFPFSVRGSIVETDDPLNIMFEIFPISITNVEAP